MTEKELKTEEEKKKKKQKKTRRKSYKKIAQKLEEENAIIKDQLLRTAAEFENYKKRTERDFYQNVELTKESVIKQMLPLMDDLERSILNVSEQEKKNCEGFISGIEMITDKFTKTMESFGVKPFNSVGEEFDVNRHEALLIVEKEDAPSNTVVEEHEKGYEINGRVIRHAKVIVNK